MICTCDFFAVLALTEIEPNRIILFQDCQSCFICNRTLWSGHCIGSVTIQTELTMTPQNLHSYSYSRLTGSSGKSGYSFGVYSSGSWSDKWLVSSGCVTAAVCSG